MHSTREDSAAELFDLHARFATDRARGGIRPVQEYLALFPGLGDEVRAAHGAITSGAELEPEDRPSLEPERRVGRYRLLRELGRGGQGAVHLAEDTQLGRKVALKMLTGVAQFSSDARRRFQREAETASRLDHPSICTIYESGFEGELAYIAMRFVEGETLSRRLARTRSLRAEGARDGEHAPCAPGDRTELAATLRFFEEAARGLHAAHEAGVIHRDVKPGNVMVSAGCTPVLLDFGLARALESSGESITQTGDQVGTPSYMSPEQIDAQGRALDRRTDVYSLGVTLYECLTLEAPFQKPTLASLYHAILREPPRDPRSWTRSIPRELVVVLETALEKDRDRRYTTALDFAEDLRRVRELQPIRARPASLGLRTLRWVQRHPARTIGIAAFLALVALGAVTWAIAEKRDVVAADLAANEQLDRDREIEDGLLDLLADTPMRGAVHDWKAELARYERVFGAYGIKLADEGELAAAERALRAAGAREPALRATLLGGLRNVARLVWEARSPRGSTTVRLPEDLGPEAARSEASAVLARVANTLVDRIEDDPWRRSLWAAFRTVSEGGADALDPFIAAAVSPEHSASDCLFAADACYRFREHEVVHRLYDAAERKPSDDPNVRYAVRVSRGQLRHQLGDEEGAWTDLRAASDVRPKVASVHQVLARIALKRRDFAAAQEHAARALALDAEDAHAALLLANALVNQSLVEEAEGAVLRALELQPDLAQAHELVGNIAWSKGDDERAFHAWDRAAELAGDPRTAWSRIGAVGLGEADVDGLREAMQRVGVGAEVATPIWLGRARRAAERKERVVELDALRAARALAPGDAEVARELGEALFEGGDRAAGLVLLREAAGPTTSSLEARLALAKALLSDPDPRRARPALESVLELDPNDERAALALAGIELKLGGDPARALELLRPLASTHRSGERFAMIADAQFRLGAGEAALDAVFDGLSAQPADPGLFLVAREALSRERARPGLDARLEVLSRAHPRVAELVALRAGLARACGDRECARTRLAEARASSPNATAVAIESVELAMDELRFDDAVAELRRALTVDPRVVELAEQIAGRFERRGAVGPLFELASLMLDHAPDRPSSLRFFAKAALALGIEHAVVQRARRAREHDAERVDAVCIETIALDALGDVAGARALLEEELSRRPGDASLLRTKATCFEAPSIAAADKFIADRARGAQLGAPLDAARAAGRACDECRRAAEKRDDHAGGSSSAGHSADEYAGFACELLEAELARSEAAVRASDVPEDLEPHRALAWRMLTAPDLACLRRAPTGAAWAARARAHFHRARAFLYELSLRPD